MNLVERSADSLVREFLCRLREHRVDTVRAPFFLLSESACPKPRRLDWDFIGIWDLEFLCSLALGAWCLIRNRLHWRSYDNTDSASFGQPHYPDRLCTP